VSEIERHNDALELASDCCVGGRGNAARVADRVAKLA
jgi:hypothetical protein